MCTTNSELGKYLFCSCKRIADKNVIGSLHFEKGRIRLIHEEGPEFKFHNPICYYLNYIDKHKGEKQFGKNTDSKETLKQSFESLNPSQNGFLFEDYGNSHHRSRGLPNFDFNPTENDIKIIVECVENALREDEVFKVNKSLYLSEARRILLIQGFDTYSPFASDSDLYVMNKK